MSGRKPYRRYPPDPIARKWAWTIVAIMALVLIVVLINKTL